MMVSRSSVRGVLARASVFSACVLVAAAAASPALALLHTRHVTHGRGRGISADEFSMSWRTSSVTPFSRPRTAPGQRGPSIDGSLVACTIGRAGASTAAGLDIRFRYVGEAGGVWGGAGDQQQPSVAGGLIAGVDRGQVAVFDPSTGAETVVSDAGALPAAPAFSGDVIVWQDHRGAGWDIYGRRFDRTTGQPSGDVFPVCTATGDQTHPAVDGEVAVWQDGRSGAWDVYACDLATMSERPVCTAPGDQTNPDVCGQTVVWQDDRLGQWHIYQYDLATAKETAIGFDGGRQMDPAISEGLVVWLASELLWAPANDLHARRYTAPKVTAYSREAGETLWTLSGDPFGPTRQARPAISGSTTVWEEHARRLPRGSARVQGARVYDLWAYNWDTTLAAPYVNIPELTFVLDCWVCPAPPVAEVGIGVADASYRADGLVWQPFVHQMTVPLPDGDGLKEYAVSFRDSAGDTMGPEGGSVVLDTHGPDCWARTPVTAQSGGIALVPYKVTDKLSDMAKVRIAVLRPDGTLVRQEAARWVETGRELKRRLDCNLVRGEYLLQVTATDLAGNQQARIGTTRLTVK